MPGSSRGHPANGRKWPVDGQTTAGRHGYVIGPDRHHGSRHGRQTAIESHKMVKPDRGGIGDMARSTRHKRNRPAWIPGGMVGGGKRVLCDRATCPLTPCIQTPQFDDAICPISLAAFHDFRRLIHMRIMLAEMGNASGLDLGRIDLSVVDEQSEHGGFHWKGKRGGTIAAPRLRQILMLSFGALALSSAMARSASSRASTTGRNSSALAA